MIVTQKPWGSPRAASLAIVVLALAGHATPAHAHRTNVPHQLVMTQVAIEGDSLRVSLWVERPTKVVVEEFRAAFDANRQRSEEQDTRFRRAQWQRMSESLFVLVDGQPLEIELKPLPLANNGRGDAQKFVYAVGGAMPLTAVSDATRVVVDIDNQVLLDQPHVFLSAYSEAGAPWRVAKDSNVALLAKGARAGAEFAPAGTTWSHDERIRRWRVVFVREP